ncbi:MAG TPA: hypothetical protein VFB12_08620, partial [Ktedonobacteraceae bacterium]|nr:hypothetical protein [Ktedonobacteraceae bacterium]
PMSPSLPVVPGGDFPFNPPPGAGGGNQPFGGAQAFPMNPPSQFPGGGQGPAFPMGSSPAYAPNNGQPQPFAMSPSLSRPPAGNQPPPSLRDQAQGAALSGSPQDTSTPTERSLKRPVIIGGLLLLVLVLVVGAIIAVQGAGQQPQTVAQTKPTPTATPVPITTTDPQTLYTQATSRKPIMTDALKAQDDNNWGVVSTAGNCAFKSGALHVSGSAGAKAVVCTARTGPNFSNFAYQVQATALSGDTVGVVFRADSMGRRLYLFSITTEGVYLLSAYDQASFQAHVLAGGTSAAINKGQNKANQITVIARGKTIYLYINKQYITKIDDTTSNTGVIGTLVGDTQGAASEAAFTDAQVWSV